MEPDFSGYATKAGLRCTDGRTIMPDAFKDNDGQTVPLVWQHGHSSSENVLGHAVLSNRPDGTYAECYFNGTTQGKNGREMVQHKDITMLSIYANNLIERSKQVFHGAIKEVSLVLSGANPGAMIDFINVAHADGSVDIMEDEAVIYTGLPIQHADATPPPAADQTGGDALDGAKLQEVYDSLSKEQKDVVNYMIGAALEDANVAHSDDDGDDSDDTDANNVNYINHQEGTDDMTRNVFEQNGPASEGPRPTLTHDQLTTIVKDAQKSGSFKDSLLAHAADYGITNIELLFPDAKAVTTSPQFVKRRTEWVAGVMDGTKHSPFSRIKSLFADITADEARAKGYIKGTLKKEEFFALTKRVTTPTTVYKKQKLDRDDMIDITDLDVVAWLKMEMRLMLEEEMAAAVMVGDGRELDDPDKIQDPKGASSGAGIRSIAHDDPFYAMPVSYDSTVDGWAPDSFIDAVVNGLSDYEGSGTPTLYTTTKAMNKILLQKDTLKRRIYASRAEVAQMMGVDKIVDLPESVMGRAPGVTGIIVNLQDYTLGTDKGGEVNMFDDFDIDYNQYKYLMEGRSSGALTVYHSALILKDEVTPVVPGP